MQETSYNKQLEMRIVRINRVLADFTLSWPEMTGLAFPQSVKESRLPAILKPGLDLINRGGKRWRPLLMQLFCEIAGGGDRALELTPLVEILHNGTLIADDIEDSSEMRRGDRCIHLKYGLDMALNSGNFLYFLPSLLIEKSPLPSEVKLAVYRYYLEDMMNLHIGQGLDIQWHRDHDYIPAEAEYFFMCRMKTGTLSRLAARLGYLIGGGSEALACLAGKICEDFGVGFQIIDDVKNLTTGNPGKKAGDDLIEGKKSLPLILYSQGRDKATTKIIGLIRAIQSADNLVRDEKISEAIALLSDSGCITRAKEIAAGLIDQAGERVNENFPSSPARELVAEVFASLFRE